MATPPTADPPKAQTHFTMWLLAILGGPFLPAVATLFAEGEAKIGAALCGLIVWTALVVVVSFLYGHAQQKVKPISSGAGGYGCMFSSFGLLISFGWGYAACAVLSQL
jgi:hypothetical protein